jgi:hypothetical protein
MRSFNFPESFVRLAYCVMYCTTPRRKLQIGWEFLL